MRYRNTRGFSLLELILYIAILSIISVVLSASFIALTQGRTRSESRTNVNSNLRFAIDKITQDVTSATLVTVPSFGTGSSFTVIASSTIAYSVVLGVLQRSVDGGAGQAITGSTVTVDAPVFTRTDNYNSVLNATTTSVQIQLTIHSKNTSPEGTYAATLESTASLR